MTEETLIEENEDGSISVVATPGESGEEAAEVFICPSCKLASSDVEGEECTTCQAIREEAEKMTIEQVSSMIREVQRLRETTLALGWGEKLSIGPFDGVADRDALDKRMQHVFYVTSYRISRALNLSLEDCMSADGGFPRVDLNASLMAISAEMAKIDTLARANGVAKDKRALMIRQGKHLGYDSERARYDWTEINKIYGQKSFEEGKGRPAKRKKARLAAKAAKSRPRPLKRRPKKEGGDGGTD